MGKMIELQATDGHRLAAREDAGVLPRAPGLSGRAAA